MTNNDLVQSPLESWIVRIEAWIVTAIIIMMVVWWWVNRRK